MNTSPHTHGDSMRERIKSKLSSETLKRAETLAKLNEVHIVTEHDDIMDDEIDQILAEFASGSCVDGYALTIVGESGAGKSALIRRRLEANSALQPEEDEYGNVACGYLSIKTPPACTMASLGEHVLERTGYKLTRTVKESRIWAMVRERLRAKQIFLVHFDEFQHALHAPKTKGITYLTDSVKNMMQDDPSWPIWLILSGVPELVELVERDKHRQMQRRSPVVEIPNIADTDDSLDFVADVLEHFATTCKFAVAIPLEREFLRRLIHGGLWRYGMTFQLIKMSLKCALWDDEAKGELSYRHFVQGYKRLSNCSEETNVFLSDRWYEIFRDVDAEGNLTSETRSAR